MLDKSVKWIEISPAAFVLSKRLLKIKVSVNIRWIGNLPDRFIIEWSRDVGQPR